MTQFISSEQYIIEFNLHNIINEMLGEVLHFKPSDPVGMMIEFMCKLRAPVEGESEASGKLEQTLQTALRQVNARVSDCQRKAEFKYSPATQYFSNKERGILGAIQAKVWPDGPTAVLPSGSLRKKSIIASSKIAQPQTPQGFNAQVLQSRKVSTMMMQIALELGKVSSTEDSRNVIILIMQSAARLLGADRCTFFFIEGEQLVSHLAEGTQKEIRMPLSAGIAGYVAVSGERINIKDCWVDTRFNKDTDLETGYRTVSMLCMPVWFDQSVVGVAQLLNKKSGGQFVPFDEEDEEVFQAFASFAGVSINNHYLFSSAKRAQRKNELILRVVEKIVGSGTDIASIDSVCASTVNAILELLQADRCTIFLVDKEAEELVSKIATNAGTSEIRVKIGEGIAGHVAKTKEMLNIPDAYTDPRFSVAVDKRMGYTTRTILCAAISNSKGDVVAVTQVINKLDGESFDEEDEEMLRYFGLFAGIAIDNANLFQFAVTSGNETLALFESSNTFGKVPSTHFTEIPSDTDLLQVKKKHLEISASDYNMLNSPDFNVLQYNTPKHQTMIVPFIYELFRKQGWLHEFDIPDDTMYRFIISALKKYRAIPYHNMFHACDVLQTTHLLVKYYKVGEKAGLSSLETFSLYIAALCHDIDHMGLNNSFHMKAETPLGVLSAASGSQSVLEVHHCALTIELLGVPTCAILKGMSVEQQRQAYKFIIHCILSTDMSKHMDFVQKLEAVTPHFNPMDPEHRLLVCQMCLKCADVSNPTKHFELSRQWGLATTAEFLKQGDAEKAQHVEVTPQFNRDIPRELARSQLGFMQYCLVRLYTSFSECFPDARPILDNLNANIEAWERILQKQNSFQM